MDCECVAHIIDHRGRVLLWEVITFTAVSLSTHIVEATMMGVGLMVLAEWCREHGVQLEYVALCSDYLGAVQSLQEGMLSERAGSVMDRIIAHVHTHEGSRHGGYGYKHSMTPKEVTGCPESTAWRMRGPRKGGREGGRRGTWRKYGWKRRGYTSPTRGQ